MCNYADTGMYVHSYIMDAKEYKHVFFSIVEELQTVKFWWD